jgi:hypothetical protein
MGLIGLLTTTIENDNILWLLVTSIVALIFALISSSATYYLVTRKKIREQMLVNIQEKSEILKNERKDQRKLRRKQEIRFWANPILNAVNCLLHRLNNILQEKEFLFEALSKNFQKKDENWSMSYDYLMNSTLYLFGQYFAWIQILRDKVDYELFQTEIDNEDFFIQIERVTESLDKYRGDLAGEMRSDFQLYRLQQQAIGELLVNRSNGNTYVMNFSEFLQKLQDEEFSQYFEPLKDMLEDLKPKNDYRWERLKITTEKLKELQSQCTKLIT